MVAKYLVSPGGGRRAYSGTRPAMENLAPKLRGAGADAVAASCPPLRDRLRRVFSRCRWQSCRRSEVGGAGRPMRALHTLSS